MNCVPSNAPDFNHFLVKEQHSSLRTSVFEQPSKLQPSCATTKSGTIDITSQQSLLGPVTSWHSCSSASSLPLRVLGDHVDNDQPEDDNNSFAPIKLWGSIRRLIDAIIPTGPPCHHPCHHPEDSPSDSNIELSPRNETTVSKAGAKKTDNQLTHNSLHSSRYQIEDTSEQELKSLLPDTNLSLPFSRSSSFYSFQELRTLKNQKDFCTNALFDEATFERDDPNSGSTDRESSAYSSIFSSSPPQSPNETPMEPLSPPKRSRVPIDNSRLHTVRDYSPVTKNGEVSSTVLPYPSPQSPLRNSDLVASLSIPTSPTSPRSPCMQPKVFSNKPPRPNPGVVKVIPTSPNEFMPSIVQSQKEKNRHIPKPIPLKRQSSSLTQHSSHLNFSSNRSSSRDIPIFANAASRAYVKSVSLNSSEDTGKTALSIPPAPTSPVSPKSTQTNISLPHPRSKIRPASPTRIKSAITPISFTKGNLPNHATSNRKNELVSPGVSDINGSNESKSSVFKSTSSFFQAARGKSFSVSSRLASSLASGKSDSTIVRSLPRNVRRVLRSQKGNQALTSQSTAQQQSTVPFFKPLQLSEVSKEEDPLTQGHNGYRQQNTSSVSRKQSEGSNDRNDVQDYESSSSFFNVTSSSIFRTSSASSASSVSRKSFLSTFRPQLKGQVENSTKSKTKSETLPRVFPRSNKPSKAASTVIPRGRTSKDLSTTRSSSRDKDERESRKSQASAQNEALLKSQVPDRPRQSVTARKNMVSSRRPPLIPKKGLNKTRVAVQLFKDGKDEKADSAVVRPKTENLNDTLSTQRLSVKQEGNSISESSKNHMMPDLEAKQKLSFDLEQVNSDAIEFAYSQNGDDSNCSGDSFNPDSEDVIWCSTNTRNADDMKAVLLRPSYGMDGNSVLLPKTMSVVKFPTSTADGPALGASATTRLDAWVFADEPDAFDESTLRGKSLGQKEPVASIKSSIFLHPEERIRNEYDPTLSKCDLPKDSEELVSDSNVKNNVREIGLVESDCPAVMNEPLKRARSGPTSRTEPISGSNFDSTELNRRASDSICIDSHRCEVHPAYRMLSDWFESELRESDLSPCVLPDEDDLTTLSHIPPVQWATQSFRFWKDSNCSHNSSAKSLLPCHSASLPSAHAFVHSNRGAIICPFHSTMVWPSCPCITAIPCQATPLVHQQSVCAAGADQSTSQLLTPPASIDSLQPGFGFRRFTGDLNVDRRILHLQLIQRQLREKIRSSNRGGRKSIPHNTGNQMTGTLNEALDHGGHNTRFENVFKEQLQLGAVS